MTGFFLFNMYNALGLLNTNVIYNMLYFQYLTQYGYIGSPKEKYQCPTNSKAKSPTPKLSLSPPPRPTPRPTQTQRPRPPKPNQNRARNTNTSIAIGKSTVPAQQRNLECKSHHAELETDAPPPPPPQFPPEPDSPDHKTQVRPSTNWDIQQK